MTGFALVLVLTSAILHASWNLLAKRVSGGTVFVWLYGVVAATVYAPLALGIGVLRRLTLDPLQLAFIVGSAIIHLAYFILLQRGYRAGDLSVVYPLARGTGPVLSLIAATLLLGERPTPVAIGGAALVAASVFMFSMPGRREGAGRAAVGFGLATGILIAVYTIWDKHAVSALAISPVLMDWATSVSRALLLAPVAATRWPEVRAQWRTYRREIIWIGVLSPASYLLVLFAMTFTPVSYVAPAREVSILFGALMGAHFLNEGDRGRRLIAATTMVAGVVALALG